MPYSAVTASRRVFLASCTALALSIAGCASMVHHDPVRIDVVGLEPLQGQGMEMRFNVKLRLQNPNEAAIDYNGIAIELDLNDKSFATGVSSQSGRVDRFGEAIILVPVTVSAFAAARQVLRMAEGGKLDNIPYGLRGKLAGGLFGTMRFTHQGTLSLPGSGQTGS